MVAMRIKIQKFQCVDSYVIYKNVNCKVRVFRYVPKLKASRLVSGKFGFLGGHNPKLPQIIGRAISKASQF